MRLKLILKKIRTIKMEKNAVSFIIFSFSVCVVIYGVYFISYSNINLLLFRHLIIINNIILFEIK